LLLLFAALLFLMLVAALSYVAFSPGGDNTLSQPKTTRAATTDDGPGEDAAGPVVVEAVETVAPATAPAELADGAASDETPVVAPATVPRADDVRTLDSSRAERLPAEAGPRNLPYPPDARDQAPEELEPPTENEDLPPEDEGSALRTAREFYTALSAGDGAAAAQYVIPAKRRSGPLSAGELTRYYSNLRRPMRLRRATPINADAVRVAYEYVLLDGRLCQGQATVYVRQGFDRPLISGIRTQGPC
jgi:hypothetical protein